MKKYTPLLIQAAVLLLPSSLIAATITVTSLSDNITTDTEVTLREAITAAETDTSIDGSTPGNGSDTIIFAPALYANGDQTIELTLFDPGDETLGSGPSAFVINTPVTILGPTGDHGITLERAGNQNFRFFDVYLGALTLENLTLKGGVAKGGDGGSGNGGGWRSGRLRWSYFQRRHRHAHPLHLHGECCAGRQRRHRAIWKWWRRGRGAGQRRHLSKQQRWGRRSTERRIRKQP